MIEIKQTHGARFAALLLLVLLVGSMLPTVAAQDQSAIQLDSARADRLDINSDGETDRVRVVYLVNTSSHWSEIAVEVIAATDSMTLTFWDNLSINRTAPHLGQTDIEAWEDTDYNIKLRLWDNISGMLIEERDFGSFEMEARLTPPTFRLLLVGAKTIYTDEPCEIRRGFSDLIGERYDSMGVVSLQGTPWLVSDSWDDAINCSTWPAGTHYLRAHYRNRLGFSASEELIFTIWNHPPPLFNLNVSGQHGSVGEACSIVIEPLGGTALPIMGIEWEVVGSDQKIPEVTLVDCTLWSPGLHKIRVTLTSPEGRETLQGYNLIRMPPAADASAAAFNASGSEETWPTRSAGASFEAEPFFGPNPWLAAGTVLLVGSIVALLAGVLVGSMLSREREEEYYLDEGLVPDSEGLPSYSDPSGIHWRQHADGNVDWFDMETGNWIPYSE